MAVPVTATSQIGNDTLAKTTSAARRFRILLKDETLPIPVPVWDAEIVETISTSI